MYDHRPGQVTGFLGGLEVAEDSQLVTAAACTSHKTAGQDGAYPTGRARDGRLSLYARGGSVGFGRASVQPGRAGRVRRSAASRSQTI